MTAGIKSSEDGYYYYTIRKADDRIPTIRELIEEAETTTLKTSGTGWLDARSRKNNHSKRPRRKRGICTLFNNKRRSRQLLRQSIKILHNDGRHTTED